MEKIGIDVPDEVNILREELLNDQTTRTDNTKP